MEFWIFQESLSNTLTFHRYTLRQYKIISNLLQSCVALTSTSFLAKHDERGFSNPRIAKFNADLSAIMNFIALVKLNETYQINVLARGPRTIELVSKRQINNYESIAKILERKIIHHEFPASGNLLFLEIFVIG